MGGYLMSFSVYTLAMVGLIFFALFIFKKVSSGAAFGKKSGFLQVEETMSISPRKTLYIVKAGKEKFLIAGDIDKTTLISKLEEPPTRQDKSQVDEVPNIVDFQPNIKQPVMKELVRKLNAHTGV